MQTLQSYIASAEPKRRHHEWAGLLGISKSHFSDVLNGKRHPGPNLIKAINALTGGAVPPAVWYLEPASGAPESEQPSGAA